MRKGIVTQTNQFELYDDGERMLGVVTVQLPPFELGSNEFTGAGVGGSINVPAKGMMNAQTATISIPKIYGAAAAYLKLGTTRTLDLRSSVVLTNTETHALEDVAERWVIKGPLSKSDPGKVENKAAGDASIDIQVYYAQHFLDGEELLEWDVFNAIHKVDGEDLLAEMKANLLLN